MPERGLRRPDFVSFCQGGSFLLPSLPLLLKPSLDGLRRPRIQKTIAHAEDLLVRLENDGVAVRLNLLGQPGEQPDFVVAGWVLPYVYALRGDRDWRRSPQLTGSRQVSQLAVHVYKQLEGGDATVAQLKQALGREVSESAVIRAITELWQQLRIIPVIAARGQAAKWQLLRTRFQTSHCRRCFDFASHGDLGPCLHLPAGSNCRQHGRRGAVPGPPDRPQQDTRSHSRAGCDAPGAHHLSRARAALLRGWDAAGVRTGLDHVRKLVYAGFRLLPPLVRAGRGSAKPGDFVAVRAEAAACRSAAGVRSGSR